MDNQHKSIKGYRDLSAEEIALMNDIKALEARVAVVFQSVMSRAKESGDAAAPRWAAMARTELETGFMYLVKAVARPDGGMGRA